jgi:hypothetical protein
MMPVDMTTPSPVFCPCGSVYFASHCHICKMPSPLYLYLTQRQAAEAELDRMPRFLPTA